MNIMLLTYQGDMAGSTNSISFLALGLVQRGHTVVVGCRKESLLFSMLSGTPVNVIPMVFNGRLDLNNIRHIADVAKKYSIELINAQSSYDRYTAILARWFHRLNCKIVHTRRQPPRSDGGFIQRQFYIRGTDKIVVVSDTLKRIFIDKGYPASHLEVIYNGTPVSRYKNSDSSHVEQLRNRLGIAPDDVVIGCVSRLKKQAQLIHALTHLDPSYKVLFVGIEKNCLDDLAQSLGVKQKIIYAGKVGTDEVLDYYKLMNVDVLPSTTDGFGLVLIEAMANGVPVVGTDFGGISDVIRHEECGLLFSDNNHEQLAASIERCIKDKTLREKLIRNGYKRALEDFSIERTIDNYENFFRRLIDTGK
ncbi:MAG: glycosyltransferase family 4 protein [Fibrobacter sp.]|jgi:glycosyltransferase involved in cell wall biosynthesis|nr:glycosyltransferase family 4 protein [Fibrobacter sp.]